MLNIRLMTSDDIPFGMTLKQANGWNQLPGDWQRFVDLEPGGCFVAEFEGNFIGTTCTVIFENVAWVAMVLVDQSYRGKGIGTALMKRALNYLREQNVSTIRLDATPMGQPVYEKLGFKADYTLARYAGNLPSRPAPGEGVEHVLPGEVKVIGEIDREVTGTDRSKMLGRFFFESPRAMRWIRSERSFVYTRAGSNARQVGPCLATSDAAPRLLEDVCHHHAGADVYMDIPVANEPACRFALSLGLTVQRRLLRMTLGPRVQENLDKLWASSGPEKG